MKVQDLRNVIKHLPGRTEIMFLNEVETEEGKLKPGLVYHDLEEDELVYIGEIQIVEEVDED